MTDNELLAALSDMLDQKLKCELQPMKNDIQSMQQDIQSMQQDLQTVKQKVTKMELTLENEIRVNIQRVAEGHLDLSRNMHDAMKPSNEIEMLSIKVRMLETDMREIKQRMLV